MATRTKKLRFVTAADLLEQLGGIPAHRVRLQPPPGKATERDLIRIQDKTNRIFELVDGVLVEKPMSHIESSLASDLIILLGSFVRQQDSGYLTGEAGAARLVQGLVRIPDVSFFSWKQLPNRERITEPIAGLAPVLAIEVLSESNTKGEMERKLREYFLAGVLRVWIVDPKHRTVAVFTAPDQSVILDEDDILDGGDLLPGFSIPVRAIFAGVPKSYGAHRRKKRDRRQPRRNGGTS
jgi:Uma2 family endonuclease